MKLLLKQVIPMGHGKHPFVEEKCVTCGYRHRVFIIKVDDSWMGEMNCVTCGGYYVLEFKEVE